MTGKKTMKKWWKGDESVEYKMPREEKKKKRKIDPRFNPYYVVVRSLTSSNRPGTNNKNKGGGRGARVEESSIVWLIFYVNTNHAKKKKNQTHRTFFVFGFNSCIRGKWFYSFVGNFYYFLFSLPWPWEGAWVLHDPL